MILPTCHSQHALRWMVLSDMQRRRMLSEDLARRMAAQASRPEPGFEAGLMQAANYALHDSITEGILAA